MFLCCSCSYSDRAGWAWVGKIKKRFCLEVGVRPGTIGSFERTQRKIALFDTIGQPYLLLKNVLPDVVQAFVETS